MKALVCVCSRRLKRCKMLPLGAVEELRMLSNFERDGKSLLQSFLLGQPEFRRTLQRPEQTVY